MGALNTRTTNPREHQVALLPTNMINNPATYVPHTHGA